MIKNVKKIAVCFLCLCLAVVICWKIATIIPLKNQVKIEMETTPSPTPYWGNVMVVTPLPESQVKSFALKKGSFGSEVEKLQSRLKELGYYTGDVDGQFGAETASSVSRFQQDKGIISDGIAGSETLALLYEDSYK